MVRWAPWVTGAGFVAAAVLALAPFVTPRLSGLFPAELSLSYTAYNCFFVGMLALSLRPGPVQRMCTVRPLRTLGRYSYGLYVLHYILFSYVQAPVRSWMAVHLTPDKAVGVVACGLIVSFLSIAGAFVSFHLYEEPFLRLKRYFSYTREAAPPSTAA